jgi:hypothetical protein
MTAQLHSTHKGITTDQQVVMGQQVHAYHLLLCTSRTCFRCHLSRWLCSKLGWLAFVLNCLS